MTHERRVWLVTNKASGSAGEEALATVLAALDHAHCSPQRIVALPDDSLPSPQDLEAARVDLVVLFGGDGSANAAIAKLEPWDGEVLVLPGGTQNLLAKSLHGDRTAEQVLDGFGRNALGPVPRHIIRSRHGDGLAEIVAGPGAMWSEVREALRERDVAELASAAREAVAQSAAGPTVALVEPPLGKPEGYPAVRLSPCGDAIQVDGYGADSLADYARQGLAILQRDFRQGPHDELGLHHEVICRSNEPIELMIDGERATGEREERFIIARCGVTLLGHADRKAE